MIETLVGALVGGTFRLAPEVLRWFDRKGERSHELAMQEKVIAFERLRGAQRMQAIEASASEAWDAGAMSSLREAIAAQGQQARVAWADALSASVRPVITYWFMALYCAAKTAVFVSAPEASSDWTQAIQGA